MKDLLESLEIGEGKIKLTKDEIKLILAKNGEMVNTEVDKTKKDLTTEIDTYKTTITDLEEKIKKLPKSDELETLKTELETLKNEREQEETNKKIKEEDELLTNNIVSAIGDKKFVNDYTKNSLINEIKTSLKDKTNVGKSAKELFEELTKDKEGIFVNPNAPKDMDEANENINTNVTKEIFDKMAYLERVSFKKENPELFKEYTTQK